MVNYFKDCVDSNAAKKLYKELLTKYHPDHAGSEGEETAKEIIKQYNQLYNKKVEQYSEEELVRRAWGMYEADDFEFLDAENIDDIEAEQRKIDEGLDKEFLADNLGWEINETEGELFSGGLDLMLHPEFAEEEEHGLPLYEDDDGNPINPDDADPELLLLGEEDRELVKEEKAYWKSPTN
jgi:hypothetical protein